MIEEAARRLPCTDEESAADPGTVGSRAGHA